MADIMTLSHPNICAIDDVRSEDGAQYFVMEYLEGETLDARLSRGGPPAADVRLGAEIAASILGADPLPSSGREPAFHFNAAWR
ncbi:MAG: hypothetical protein ABI837_14060 [Acidobacteriota bacterium]